jgi:hypothetical protein
MLTEVHMLEKLHHANIVDYKHAWLEHAKLVCASITKKSMIANGSPSVSDGDISSALYSLLTRVL